MHRRRIAAAAVVAVASAATSAEAATKSVTMGPPPAGHKQLGKYRAEVNAFFPRTVTVRVGDTVRFVPSGFHNLDLPARGEGAAPLLAPTGTKVTDVKDEAGAPFWFNGQDNLGFNPALFKSNFGKKLSAPSSKRINSGLPLGPKLKPMSVRFTKTGTFGFLCDVHPGMKGTVKVVGKKKSVPSAKADRAAVKKQIAQAASVAKRLAATKAADGVVSLGAAGPGGVEVYRFFPDRVRVPVGTTMRFQMSKGSYDVHTATAGPGDAEKEPKSYLGTLSSSFQSPVFDPRALYPSDPPSGTAAELTPTSHGNGFYNTGILDQSTQTPNPASNAVTFRQAGSYSFVCLIHPFMKATVVAE